MRIKNQSFSIVISHYQLRSVPYRLHQLSSVKSLLNSSLNPPVMMGIYHIGKSSESKHVLHHMTANNKRAVLFKLKPGYEESTLDYWKQQVHALVGVVQGR